METITRRASVEAMKGLAYEATLWTSLHNEENGERLLTEAEQGLSSLLAQLPTELHKLAERKYLLLYKQWLGAMGRCFSLITGLGKRTRSRQEKTNQYKQDAYERLQEWQERIIKRANSQHGQTGWEEIVRLEELLEDMERLHEAMKAANKATRSSKLSNAEKDDELVALGFSESRAIRLRLSQELHGSAFPPSRFY